jgi:hypothetical protein
MIMMRRILQILVLSIFAASCNKPDPVPDPVFATNSFSANIDSKPFHAGEFGIGHKGDTLILRGTANPGSSKSANIELIIPHYAGLATYGIDTLAQASYTSLGNTFWGTSGQVTITSDNSTHVEGAFSFNAGGSVMVTSGKFDLYK